MRPTILLIVEVPDERINWHHRRDHLHVWFDDAADAKALSDLLHAQLGADYEIVDWDGRNVFCPRCGATEG